MPLCLSCVCAEGAPAVATHQVKASRLGLLPRLLMSLGPAVTSPGLATIGRISHFVLSSIEVGGACAVTLPCVLLWVRLCLWSVQGVTWTGVLNSRRGALGPDQCPSHRSQAPTLSIHVHRDMDCPTSPPPIHQFWGKDPLSPHEFPAQRAQLRAHPDMLQVSKLTGPTRLDK